MVTLVCFSCDHRNPLGARFCNACGTPMHLRPCKHCEAINARAAAHCHQCGEAFDIAFAEDDGSDLATGVESAPPAAVGAMIESPPPTSGFRGWRTGAVTFAVISVAAVLMALGPFRERLLAAGTQPTEAVSSVAHVAAAVVPAPLPVAAAAVAAPEVTADAAPAAETPTIDRTAPLSTSRPTATPRATARTPASSSKRPASAAQQRAVAAQGRATGGSRRDSGRATDRVVVASQQRPAEAGAPKQRRQRAPQAPTGTGRWEQPCAEGRALEASCDVRLLAKGN